MQQSHPDRCRPLSGLGWKDNQRRKLKSSSTSLPEAIKAINLPSRQPADQLPGQLTNKLINQPTNLPNNHPTNLLSNQPTNHQINHPTHQTLHYTLTDLTMSVYCPARRNIPRYTKLRRYNCCGHTEEECKNQSRAAIIWRYSSMLWVHTYMAMYSVYIRD